MSNELKTFTRRCRLLNFMLISTYSSHGVLLINSSAGIVTCSRINDRLYLYLFSETSILSIHFENMPMQYTDIFKVVKPVKFSVDFFFEIFLIFAQNIDCGYSLEPPRRGGSNVYPQSMF